MAAGNLYDLVFVQVDKGSQYLHRLSASGMRG
jgi:hypothetical protein